MKSAAAESVPGFDHVDVHEEHAANEEGLRANGTLQDTQENESFNNTTDPVSCAITTVAAPAYPAPDEAAMLATLKVLVAPGSIVELRAIKAAGKPEWGYFDSDNWPKLVRAAADRNRAGAQAYITLNEVSPDRLSAAPNGMVSRKGATSDNDIVRRRWLPIDLDPVRGKVSSTDAELKAAADIAQAIVGDLQARGWPMPVVAESGNGMHLLYPIDMPNTAESDALVKSVLEGLDSKYSTAAVNVDDSVGSAGQIFKFYGSVAMKGPHTPDRPHRRASILHVPKAGRRLVTAEQLHALADGLAPAPVKQHARRQDPAVVHDICSGERAQILSDLQEALQFLDFNDRGEWVDVGMALKTLGEDVRHLWMAWSRGYASFDQNEADRTWAGFKPEHTSYKVVFARASAKGWVNKGSSTRHDTRSQAEIDAEIAKMLAGNQAKKAQAESGGAGAGAGVGDGAMSAAEAADGADDDSLSGLSLAPVFDYRMVPGVLGKFIRSETENSEAPEIGVLGGIVTRLSADLGRTAYFRIGRDVRHIRINWLSAGKSGHGRKGTASSIANAVRKEAFKKRAQERPWEADQYKPELEGQPEMAQTLDSLSTGEGLIAMVRTSESRHDKEEICPPGDMDNRLLVEAPEFSGILKKASGKESSLSSVLRNAADGIDLSNASIANRMTAEKPHIVIGASVPDSELVRLLSGDSAVEASNGLINRFVVTSQSRGKIVPRPKEGDARTFNEMVCSYKLALATAWGHGGKYSPNAESTSELTRTDEAEDLYCNWYEAEQARPEADYIKTLMVRAPTVVLSYASLLALLRGSLRAEAGDIQASIALVAYWRSSLEFIFSRGQETVAVMQMAADARALLSRLTIGEPTPMGDLKDVWTAKKRRQVLDWGQRQSPPLLSIARVPRTGGGRSRELVTRLA